MAVNLSPRQFRDNLLYVNVVKAIKKANVPAASLELEITEGALLSGHNHIDETLRKLSKLGVSVAMDDFGTGYSSLSYLRQYPFDVLNIDRSFVRDICIDNADKELINAAIAMAHALDLKVVAEGVETEQQQVSLKKMASDFVQGYLFSKPISTDQLLDSIIHEQQASSILQQ